MDNLFSIDEHRKTYQKNIEKEIEGYRLIDLAKRSRSSSPGTAGRIFIYIKTVLGIFVSRVRCSITQKTASIYRKSNVEIKPC